MVGVVDVVVVVVVVVDVVVVVVGGGGGRISGCGWWLCLWYLYKCLFLMAVVKVVVVLVVWMAVAKIMVMDDR